MVFDVFDLLVLTMCINCSLLHLYPVIFFWFLETMVLMTLTAYNLLTVPLRQDECSPSHVKLPDVSLTFP